ncbi:MAG: AraC family transcriptional regulator [Velocimicrobium sp.]
MSVNITDQVKKVKKDEISILFDCIELEIIGASRWRGIDYRSLNDFTLSNFQFIFIVQGRARIQVVKEKESFIQMEDKLYLFEPFTRYCLESVGVEPLVFYYLAFDMRPYSKRSSFTNIIQNASQELRAKNSFKIALGQIIDEIEHYENQIGYYKALEFSLWELILLMARNRMKEKKEKIKPKCTRAENLVNLSICYLETHLKEPISIEKIAKENYIGTNTLYKAFKEVASVGPSQFLSQYKLRLVSKCLNETNLSLEEIANRYGYSSASHLSKNYKKLYGMSPRKW